MKKVTMFVWNNFVNDARVLREAKALQESGYEVTVIAKKERTERSLKATEKIAEGITVRRAKKPEFPAFLAKRLHSQLLRKHVPNFLGMLSMLKMGCTLRTDIYHSHDLNTLLMGVISAKLRPDRKPLIYDSHEVQTSRTHYNVRKVYAIERMLMMFADKVIVENATRGKYHEMLYGDRPTAVHNYSELYDIDKVGAFPLRQTYGIPADEKIVLYQGGLQEGRGLFKLLDAFSHIEGARLVLIGDGKERENLIDYHHQLQLENKVIFIQRVPYQSLRAYTKAADIGIQFLENTNFNHYSASSNKLFEYLMAHVPVIGSDLPEIAAVIDGEQVGLTVPEGDTSALTAALHRLITDDGFRRQCQLNTRHAKMKYNWNNEKSIIQSLYSDIFRSH